MVWVLSGDNQAGSGVGKLHRASVIALRTGTRVMSSSTVKESGEDMRGDEDDLVDSPLFKWVSFVGCCLWKQHTRSSEWTLSAFSHWFSDSGYPFHLIRYCS